MNATITKTQQPKLPDGWKWVKLGDVCKIIRGVNFKNSSVSRVSKEGWVPILRAGNISNHLITDDNLIWVTPDNVNKPQLLQTGDIAMCMSSGSRKVVGKTAQLKYDWYGSVGAFCSILRVNQKYISDYIYFWLNSNGFLEWRDKYARGVSIQNLRNSELSLINIPLPPLDEQKRITAKLNEQMGTVEEARKMAEGQLEAAKALPNAYLRQIFPSNEDDLPNGWEWVKLGDVCEKPTTHDPRKAPRNMFVYVDISSVDRTTKKIVGQKAILGKDAPSRARKQIQFNDVIVSTTRPNLNAVALVPSELDGQICSTGFCVLRPQNLLNSEYLLYCVSNKTFVNKLSSLVVGALYPAVSDRQVFSQMIPLPPLDEQKRITAKLKEQMKHTTKLTESIEQELDVIKALPAAILRKAFAGEL